MTESPAVPAISVVLFTQNQLPRLQAILNDIYAQTRQDWELIVVDNGSTDGTVAWLEQQGHSQMRVLSLEKMTAFDAINAGIRAARGTYVTWISADHRCTSYFLEALSVPLDQNPHCVMAYSSYFGVDIEDRIFTLNYNNLQILRELMTTNAPRGNAGFLYRKSVHERLGYYEGWGGDTLMWARMLDGEPSVFVVEPTYFYRFHDDQALVKLRADVERDKPLVLKDFIARNGGMIDAVMLQKLYPALTIFPDDAVDAAADFSMRMFMHRAVNPGLNLQLSLIGSVKISALYAPIVSFITCTVQGGADPLPYIRTALNSNAGLSSEQRTAMEGLAASLIAAQNAGIIVKPPMLPNNHRLLRLERPTVFSYTAWREQKDRLKALPALNG